MTTVLVLVENLDTYLPILESSGFQLIRAPTAEKRAEAIATHGQNIRAVVTRGHWGFSLRKWTRCRTCASFV